MLFDALPPSFLPSFRVLRTAVRPSVRPSVCQINASLAVAITSRSINYDGVRDSRARRTTCLLRATAAADDDDDDDDHTDPI